MQELWVFFRCPSVSVRRAPRHHHTDASAVIKASIAFLARGRPMPV
jgi:hypothetical protein